MRHYRKPSSPLGRPGSPWATVILGRFDTASEHVGDEEADGLRLQIEIGACSPFVVAFRKRAGSSSLTSTVNLRSPRRAVLGGRSFAQPL